MKKRSKLSRKRKSRLSSKSSDKILKTPIQESVLELTTRMILQPNQKIQYTIHFKPKQSGTYNFNFLFKFLTYFEPITVKCSGICDLPRIELIYSKTIDSNNEQLDKDNNVYIEDLNLFHFGSIFIGNSIQNQCTIKLRNISSLPASINMKLVQFQANHFGIDPKLLIILPGSESDLKLSVNTCETGLITSILLFNIRDNPKVEELNLAANCCLMEIFVEPQNIDFHKTIIGEKRIENVLLSNKSPINVGWRLNNFKSLKWLEISQTNGILQSFSVLCIHFQFNPKDTFDLNEYDIFVMVLNLHNINFCSILPIYLQFFDLCTGNEYPLFYKISIFMECVEINVDFNKCIEIGIVKAHTLHNIPYTVTNNGKYPVKMRYMYKIVNCCFC